MKLQFEATQIVYRKFGDINKPMNAANAAEFQDMISKWTESFPPMLGTTDPDISMDNSYPWIPVHRQYLHVMAYTMILMPLRSYITRVFDQTEPLEEQNTRASGVDYCLKLRDAHIDLFHSTYPFCAKYHLAQFSLVDLGKVLCSAIIHDTHRNLPKRDQVIAVIGDVAEMLRHIQNAANRLSLSYKAISKLIKRLPVSQAEMEILHFRTITVNFDQRPQLNVVPENETADGQGESAVINPMDSMGGLPTPVSIKTEPGLCQPISQIEGPGKALLKFDPKLASGLESANVTSLSTQCSTASFNMVGREHGTPIQSLLQEDIVLDQQNLSRPDPKYHYRSTSPTPTSTKPFLEVFLERFLDSYGPEMPASWQPLHWIHSGQPYKIWRVGAAARDSSTLLCNSFTAVSVVQFGRSIDDWRFVSAADRIYVSVLRSLQAAISHPEQSRSDDVLWSVILCAVYEVSTSRSRVTAWLSPSY